MFFLTYLSSDVWRPVVCLLGNAGRTKHLHSDQCHLVQSALLEFWVMFHFFSGSKRQKRHHESSSSSSSDDDSSSSAPSRSEEETWNVAGPASSQKKVAVRSETNRTSKV